MTSPTMTDDRLLALANHPWGRPIVRALGLPQPLPLVRRTEAYGERELMDRRVQILTIGEAPLRDALRTAVADQGGLLTDVGPVQTLLVDATACLDIAGLRALFQQVQSALPRLSQGGRVLLLGEDASELAVPLRAACAQALHGFTRSLAKELGRKAATANLLVLPTDILARPVTAESLVGALRYFGNDRSAYISGQVLAWRPHAASSGTRAWSVATAASDAASALASASVGAQASEPVASPSATRTARSMKTALVTGAAGGIGAMTARRLAREGYRVVCVDVPATQDALIALTSEIGGELLAIDLVSAEAAHKIAAAAARFGGLDVLVHNAGITRDRTLTRMSAAEWDQVIAVNLAAIAAIDDRLDVDGLINEDAREICLSSISGIAGNAGQTNYSASKAALIGYVRARADELSTRGITVNAVAPGYIETSMTRRIPLMLREAGRRLNALKQGGRPEDVAEAIAFLAAPTSGPVSAQVLRVCGQSLLGA